MNPSGRRHTGPFFARTPWSCVAEWPYYSVNVVVEGFGSIHGSYVEPGEPIDTVGAPEDLQARAEQGIAASREVGLINTLHSGPGHGGLVTAQSHQGNESQGQKAVHRTNHVAGENRCDEGLSGNHGRTLL